MRWCSYQSRAAVNAVAQIVPPCPRPGDKVAKFSSFVCKIGDRFKTLSLTLEMPFKDTIENPDPIQGWSPGRTKSFGASILNPIVDTVPFLDG